MAVEGRLSPTPRTRLAVSELRTRVVSAIFLIGAALVALTLGGWTFRLFWLAAGLVTLWEWLAITAVRSPLRLQITLSAALILVSFVATSEAPWLFACLVGAALAWACLFAQNWRSRFWAIGGFIYAVVLALVPPLILSEPTLALPAILWMFAVVWATDIAAYFTGRALGGPKLWPSVSPKKTWSGFFGGLVGGVVAGLGVMLLALKWGVAPPYDLSIVTVVSVVASVTSQAGDLGESALKRAFDVKDSGRLIPGHGGVMDRVDGFWAVCLLAGIWLLIMQVM